MIVESYYSDSEVVKSIYPSRKEFVNDIYPEIQTIIEACRLEEQDTYLDLYNNYDYGKKQKILYTLIEQSLYDRYPDQFPFYTENFDQLFQESFAGIATGMSALGLGSLLAYVLSQTTPVKKIAWTVMAKFQAVNEKIHKFITNITKSGRVKLSIVFNNADECYQKCGINKKEDISQFIGGSLSGVKHGDRIVDLETGKGRTQAYCLTSCYVNWSLKQVETLMQSYLNCLRTTGERGFELNDIKLMLMTAPSSSMCDPYFKLLKEHKKAYDDLLDIVCADSVEKEEFLRKYNETLNKAASNVGRINSNQKYNLEKNYFNKNTNNNRT